jgi:hypothetical protein
MRSIVPTTHVAAFISVASATSRAPKKAALLLFSVAVLLAGVLVITYVPWLTSVLRGAG